MTVDNAKIALKIAREAIEARLNGAEYEIPRGLPEKFAEDGAVFVTLKTMPDGALRGCIGSIVAHRQLALDIADNAVASAVRDPRFMPLKKEELKSTKIELSVLTPPMRLSYNGADDLLRKIRPNIDGVIIRLGGAQATFLPSVWEELPNIHDFFAHLCRKAGLSIDFYKTGNLEVFTYQAEKFEEH